MGDKIWTEEIRFIEVREVDRRDRRHRSKDRVVWVLRGDTYKVLCYRSGFT